MILEKVNNPSDLKSLSIEELNCLSGEIRKALITKMSVTGGHMASNLGIVEITVALHAVFNSPVDKIIFDVSHQSYVHKILTGRKEAFLDKDHYNDVSGFSNPDESEHDFFNIGHTSTSISLACGMAKARDLKGQKHNIIAVIGDASLDGGEAFEALNYAKELKSGLIVVINDNNMSIPENYGALKDMMNSLRENDGIVQNNFFEALGFRYLFVKDGHDIKSLMDTFKKVKDTDCPVVIHCCTQKGKGYIYAEQDKEKWHWAKSFDISSGKYMNDIPSENYGAIAASHLLDKMKQDKNIVVIAASTPICIGFNSANRKLAGTQFIDLGIAEQNAVTMTAAIAKCGGKPIFATNSTFYQRAYDQIEQEMCISRCPATMIVSHASVWGHTNDTHAGLFDITLFSNIPNLIYLAPTNCEEYLAMLDWSIDQDKTPVAIRIPWTKVFHTDKPVKRDYSSTEYQVTVEGKDIAILALGSFYQIGEQVVEMLRGYNIDATLINPIFITGLDKECLDGLKENHKLVVTLEDGILNGGFGSRIAQYYSLTSVKVLNKGIDMNNIPNRFAPSELIEANRLSPHQITEDILRLQRDLVK